MTPLIARDSVATFSARPTSVWISTYAVTVMSTPNSPRGCGSQGTPTAASRAEPLLEGGELLAQRSRQPFAEVVERRADARELASPLLDVDRERGVDHLARYVEPVEVEIVDARHDADRCRLARRVAVEPAEDPLEHARVLAEAGPEEP